MAWVFLRRSSKRRLLPPGGASIRIIKVGAQNEPLPPWGGQARRRSGGGRRLAGVPRRPAPLLGGRAGASSSSKTPFYQPDPPLLSGGMAHAGPGRAPTPLRVRFVSPAVPGLTGAGGAAERDSHPAGDTTLCASCLCACIWGRLGAQLHHGSRAQRRPHPVALPGTSRAGLCPGNLQAAGGPGAGSALSTPGGIDSPASAGGGAHGGDLKALII